MSTPPDALLHTPLYALHVELGARLVPFAGYEMPVAFPSGILAEHRRCRESAALFDVSHMGQIALRGDGAAAALESLVPADLVGLGAGRQRYGFFTLPSGGLLDDCMSTRPAPEAGLGDLLLIVNAARKAEDLQHLQQHLDGRCRVEPLRERALLALQGPQAAGVLARLHPGVERLLFMSGGAFELDGTPCFVTRSGYTGEDGFESSGPAARAEALARRLLREPEVGPAGLGARDTLRLEAGLCLYGHDIDVSTTPIEAGLGWAIPKARRPGGPRAGGYPGAATIEAQMIQGVPRRRVGLLGVERVPVREGTELADAHGHPIGRVTSGTIGPSLNQAIAMGYVTAPHAAHGHEVFAVVRGRSVAMRVAPLPFRAPRYVRG